MQSMTLVLDGAVEVVQVRLDVMPDRVRDLTRRLSATERRRAERLVVERNRRRYAVARGLLREQLASRLGVAPDQVVRDVPEAGAIAARVFSPRESEAFLAPGP